MRDNVFENDVVIPKSVLDKLDIALEQTRVENEFETDNKKKSNNKKKNIKIKAISYGVIGVAACAALVITTVINKTNININQGQNVAEERSQENENVATSGLFTITASAAELIPGQKVNLTDNENSIFMTFSGFDNNEGYLSIGYTIPSPILVTGENISTVTYSINRGAFQLLSKAGEEYIRSGVEWGELTDMYSVLNLNEDAINGDNDEQEDAPAYDVHYYTEFTIDYDNQEKQKNGFNFVGAQIVSEDLYDLIFPDTEIYQANAYNELTSEGLDQLLNDTIITVTAQYKDGSQNTQYIRLGGMLIGDPYAEDPDLNVTAVSGTLYTDVPTTGATDSNEYKACMEYNSFLDTYDQDQTIINQIGNSATEFDEKYGAYLVYTQEMADKVDEICTKYNLKLIDINSWIEMYSTSEFKEKEGVELYREGYCGNISGYGYGDGSFHLDGDVAVNNKSIDYQIERHMKGTFSTVILRVNDYEIFKQWDYTTSDGVNTKLSLGPDKALIQVSLDNSFVFVNVLHGTDVSWLDTVITINEADLEALAESFNFKQY